MYIPGASPRCNGWVAAGARKVGRAARMADDTLRRKVIADQQQLVHKVLADSLALQRAASRKRSFLFIALMLLAVGAWRFLSPQRRLGQTIFNQAVQARASSAPLTAADATERARNTLGQLVGDAAANDTDDGVRVEVL